MREAVLLLMLIALSACIAEEGGDVEVPPVEVEAPAPTTPPPQAMPEESIPLDQGESTPEFKISPLWSFATGEPVYGVDAGKHYVAAASYDNTVYLLNMSGNLLWKFKTQGNAEAVALSEGENYLVAASYLIPEARIYLFRLANGDATLIWEKKLQSGVKGVAISEDADLVVIAARDGNAYAYSLEGKPRWTFKTQKSAWGVWDVAIEGKYVALAADDTYLYFLDTGGKLLWKRGGGKGGYLYGCALSSKLVAGAAQDKTLYVYSTDGRLMWKFRSGFSNYDVAIDDNLRLIALSSWDKKVYLLSYSGEKIAQLDFEQEPTGVDFSSDGATVAIGNRDGKLYLFGIEN
ncbi:WD40 repeat domain-containing protein [Candidatus Pyrohabitans sp.]